MLTRVLFMVFLIDLLVVNAFINNAVTPKIIGAFISKPRSKSSCDQALVSFRVAATADDDVASTSEEDVAKTSLEEKMKSWEASEDEIKAASLGGLYVGKEKKTDGFDIGLAIAFPIMIASSVLFLIFPLIKDSIDVTSVGPPPMV